jgi:competence protein ComEC
MEIVCFFTAVVCVYHQASWLSCGIGLLLVFRPSLRYIVWFGCGIFWAYLHQWLAIKPIADLHEVAHTYVITGHIETIPAVNTDKIKFQFLTDSINQQHLRCHLLLSCYQHCPKFALGKSLQLKVKLKPPKGKYLKSTISVQVETILKSPSISKRHKLRDILLDE